jgi:hypothetical protein
MLRPRSVVARGQYRFASSIGSRATMIEGIK